MESKDIIKVLECCTKNNCEDCPYKLDWDCESFILENTLELIENQQAEIEKLKQNLKEAHIDIKEHLAEIEKLKKQLTENCSHQIFVYSRYEHFFVQEEIYIKFVEQLKKHGKLSIEAMYYPPITLKGRLNKAVLKIAKRKGGAE